MHFTRTIVSDRDNSIHILTLVHLGVFTKKTPLPKIACHFKSDVPRAMKTLDFFFGIIYHLLIEFFFLICCIIWLLEGVKV